MLETVSATYQGADDDRYTVERSIEISSAEMRALHDERLRTQAHRDALTGLPNRMGALEQLGIALASARRHGGSVSVLLVDVDGFERINDSVGHAAGDALLVGAGERISTFVRGEDIVARVGGDEFAVVSRSTPDPLDASRMGERIVAALEEPFRTGRRDSLVSASVGVSLMTGAGDTAESLLRQAELAMHRARDHGGARTVLFDPAMQKLAQEHAELESAVRQAVERGELVLHYQALLRIGDGAVQGYEALVRWNRPGHGLVGPDQFIPVAERSALISAIGRWVIAEACSEAAGWPEPWQVSVNLGAQELAHEDVVGFVSEAIERSGLEARRLTIELTESTMLSSKEHVASNLARLRGLGVSIAIDDFGTGYSSLSYLRAVPATTLKIDRSFVRDLDEVGTAPAIIGAIITMGHALGLSIVAEGVERREQLELLSLLGCDTAQGFLLARPVPAAQLPHRAVRHREVV
ncbi:MAG TPA: EAL domain-containing protein [Solirubrobacteraceae bacterium]|jgi:diguanylate cyclase (GGDEF)-like protein